MARVVITGIGTVVPGGIGKEDFWNTLLSGVPTYDFATIEHSERYRSRVVAAITDWDPRAHGLTEEETSRVSRHTQFALVAAAEAWTESGLNPKEVDLTRLGVSAGTAIGSALNIEQEYLIISREATDFNVDPSLASPYLYHAMSPTSLSAELAGKYQASGPVVTISTGCTAGIDALFHAFEWIRDGDADIVIAGASDAGVFSANMASFDAIKATTPESKAPKEASRPFDARRNGFVLGEGGAFLILEELEHALGRGSPMYAEIKGCGSMLNAYHMTGLPRNGLDMSQSIKAALLASHVPLDDVQYINAHGSSTLQNDIHETNAFKQVWQERAYTIPVSSIKSIIGHSLGAAGAIEVAACALAIQRHVLPPTINYRCPDPACDLDYVPNQAREQVTNVVVSTASGFGGFQSALVLSHLS